MSTAPHILIVEDEEPLTLLLRYNLEAEGYNVEVVSRGDEAELRLRETVPDLVLLDWMLPGLSGIELCRRLRQRAETQRLPVIMLTARGEEIDRVPRHGESYVKDWKPLKLGTIDLKPGRGKLTLRAEKVAGKRVADVRMVLLTLVK